MSSSLLDSLSQMVTPDLLSQAASALGENQGNVSCGIAAVLPMLLGGVASRANDTSFASSLFKLVTDSRNDVGVLGDLGKLLSPAASNSPSMALGGQLLGSLFGNNLGAVGNALAGYAGIRPQSANSLLSMAAPMVLALLGKQVKAGGLNLSSLASLLTGQKSSIAATLPSGLNLDRYLAAPAAVMHQAVEPAKSSIWRWLLPLLLVLGLLWLLSRCMGGRDETTTMTPAPAVEPGPMPEPLPAPVAQPTPVEMPLANLYFEVDNFELPAAREGSLESVIAYLLANPTAVAAVSGYHDPTGDKAHNEELSKQRAQSVKDAMMAAGVPESQIDLVKPIESTGSGDMAEARRVEVSIRR